MSSDCYREREQTMQVKQTKKNNVEFTIALTHLFEATERNVCPLKTIIIKSVNGIKQSSAVH